MTAAAFCKKSGFELVMMEQPNGRFVIDIKDHRKVLFKSGERKGKMAIHGAILEAWTKKIYNELMDLILEERYT